jgi:hypothetical protein
MPRCYEVKVHVADDGCGKKVCACPHVQLLDGSKAVVSFHPDGKGGYRLMHLHVVGIDDRTAKLHLQLTGKEPGSRMEAVQVVHLNKATGVALAGKAPEPCCAEVTVRAVKPGVVSAPKKAPLPAPMPVHSIVHSYAPVPPPAPVAWPVPPMAFNPPIMPAPVPAMPTPVAPAYAPPMTIVAPMAPPAVLPPAHMPMQVIHARHIVTAAKPTCVELCKACGKNRLHVQAKDGTTSKGVRMTVECPSIGALHLAAGKKYVHISGKEWKASADHVQWHDDGRIVLTGNVKLSCDHIGCCATVKAEKLCVQVRGGKFEKIVGK